MILTLVATGLVATQLATTATADTRPPAGLPDTVSADALAAPSIAGGIGGTGGGGVVWATAMSGNTVFAGGNFTTATSPGGQPVSRTHLLAFDVTTGQLTGFSPTLNQQVRALSLSPDGETLYAAGDFSTVDGVARRGVVALDVDSGDVVQAFDPPSTSALDAVVATATTVYVGGSFGAVSGQPRANLAAFTASGGDLLDWAPAATGGPVIALTADPSGTKVAVGGYFTALNGSSNPGYGLGMLDATSGATLPMAVNGVVRNGRPPGRGPDDPDGAIYSLSSTGDTLYGTGFTFASKSAGTLEGVFSASWNGGGVNWVNDCHGDAYDVQAIGDVVYAASHTHYCENLAHGGVRQGPGGVGSYPYYRAIAMTNAATGTATWEPDQRRYQDFRGQPTPTMLGWYPDFNQGTFTGQSQGPWTVTGNSQYVVIGGEFTRVNDSALSGLVRFAVGDLAPNDVGPQYCWNGCDNTYPINVTSTAVGEARVNWTTNRDNDNERLTYRVRRENPDGTTTLVQRRDDVFGQFWNPFTMGVTDGGLAPGATYRYRVEVTDPYGNSANSAWTPVTVATAGADSSYVKAVYAAEPTSYWRLGDPAGSATASPDRVGFQPLTTGAGVTRGGAGAIPDDADSAFVFDGTEAGAAVAGDLATACPQGGAPADLTTTCWPPDVFALETWFATTSTRGGRLVGWSNETASRQRRHDRQLYMSDDGALFFGVKPDDRRLAIASRPGLNDGRWHHAVASLSASGMRLYVDGVQVASRSDVTVGEHLSIGTWRLGGDTLAGWPGQMTSGYFAGSLDEVAVYKRELAAAEVEAHYTAGGGVFGLPLIDPPTVKRFEIRLVGKAKLKGKLRVGERVKVTGARWNTDVKVRYRWFVKGKVVKKATKRSFMLTKRMAGKRLKVVLTARAAGLPSAKVTVRAKGKIKPARGKPARGGRPVLD